MSQAETVLVLQARMGSARLPGKVLLPIDGRTILAHCIARLAASGCGPVVVATTTGAGDDVVEAEARRQGAVVIRGPRDDVLQRFLLVADSLNARVLVRATADNPAVDLDAPGRVLRALADRGADHVVESGLPVGAAVEAVRVDALREAARITADSYDREHVTPCLRNRPDCFRACAPEAPPHVRRPDLRLTVDTPGDLRFVRAVFARAGAGRRLVTLADLIAAADATIRAGSP